MHDAPRRGLVTLSVLQLAILGIACGRDTARSPTTASSPSTVQSYSPPNACPMDGCRVRIVSATPAGDEIRLSFDANYTADVSRNHFHVFWDTYAAKQVSVDAATRFGATVGDWEPTADNPYVTTGPVSVGARGQSTSICVTAGDRNHNVIDPSLVDCRDLSGLLRGG